MENQTANFEEKRRFKRVPLEAEAECEIFSVECQALMLNRHNHKATVKVDNMSMGGLRITTDMLMAVEQILRMKIKISSNGFVFWVYTQVRWSRYDSKLGKYRVGLEFFYLKEKPRKMCSELIDRLLN